MPHNAKPTLISQVHCGFQVRSLSHSFSYSNIPKIHYTLSTTTIKGAVTIHISLIKKNKNKKQKSNKNKNTGRGSQIVCLRSLCFGTRNLNLANLTPKSALAYDGLGDILGHSAPPREPVFSCLMHSSILSCICLLLLSPFFLSFSSFKFLIIRPL